MGRGSLTDGSPRLAQHAASSLIRLMFSAKHTRCHSPRTFSTPRRLNRLNPGHGKADDTDWRPAVPRLLDEYPLTRPLTAAGSQRDQAAIIIGVISLTGLGLKFSTLVVTVSGGNLLAALMLTMIASLILGMACRPRRRTSDAALWNGSFPLPPVIKLGSQHPVKLIPIPEDVFETLNAKVPPYFRNEIPGGSYKGIPEAVPSYGLANGLVIDADVDEDLVYRMTRAIYENLAGAQGRASSVRGRHQGNGAQRIRRAASSGGAALLPGDRSARHRRVRESHRRLKTRGDESCRARRRALPDPISPDPILCSSWPIRWPARRCRSMGTGS